MSCRGGEITATAAAVAAACTSRQRDSHQEQIDSHEYQYEDEEDIKHLSLHHDVLFAPLSHKTVGERDKDRRENARRNQVWAETDCHTTTTTTADGKNESVVEPSVAEKFSVDFEKWLKTRVESTSMDIDTAKVVENVDHYLSGEELSSHSFLENPYGLSIDIDLATGKKDGLNLASYDPILQDELPTEKLLEPCEKVDDEYILPEFQLYPLTLSSDDMMVAGEILPSTSGQPATLNVMENHQEVENRTRATQINLQSNSDEPLCEKSSQEVAINQVNIDLKDMKGKEKKEEKKEKVQKEIQKNVIKSHRQDSDVQSLKKSSEFLIESLVSTVDRPSNPAVEVDIFQNNTMERLKAPKITKVRLKPPSIIKKRQMSEQLEVRFDKQHTNNKSFVSDDAKQNSEVMAVVAISTDKISNMTQIVINTGTEKQIYQGKTSELIEATQGNFPMLPKIDAAVWNGMPNAEFNGSDHGNQNNSQYEIVISDALRELGITDDSLQPVCITEHDKVWLCPRDDCNRQFGRLYTLKGHLLAHYGVRPFKCDFEGCTWAFHSEFKLKRHKETHLKRKDYLCEVEGCNRRFTTVYNLWSHTKLHSRPNHIICQVPDCNEKFQTKRALELHMKSHDQRHAPYVCQHEGCGKRYYSSNALTSHQRSHSYKEIDVKCSWPGCGKVFDKPCRLKAHTRSHTGCKPYHCTYQDCKWAFSSSSKLKRHQKKHTNERKFACDVPDCGKAFMRSEHLKEHRLTHTEGRYFRCFVCDARFSAKSSLYVHIKKHQIKTTAEESTNVAEDVPECSVLSVAAAMAGQKHTRMEELLCSQAKPINVKTPNQRSAESIHAADADEEEHFRLEEEGDVSSNNVEHLNAQESACVYQPTIHPTRSQTDQLRMLHYCPIETCSYFYGNEASLRQHMLKAHGVVIAHDLMKKVSSSNAVMDIFHAVPTPSSSSSSVDPITAIAAEEQMIMLMTDDARIVSLSVASPSSPSVITERSPPEPEPPPPTLPLFNNVALSKNAQLLRNDEQQITQILATNRNKEQGSARTGLTFADVLKLKINDALTDTDTSPSDAVALGAGDLLLTEDLPSMYYQDDAAGAEYQVLLLDSNPLESTGNLRGLE